MPPKPFQFLPTALPGIDAMQADSHFAFGRHMHLQFGLGVIDRGAQKSFSGRGTVESLPGDTITVNPGEVHDGKPLGDGGRAWRMLYLEPALVAGLAAEVRPRTPGAGFEFHAPNLRDARLAAQVRALFAAATRHPRHAAAPLQVEECLLQILACLLRPADKGRHMAWSLADLAREVGLSRYQLVRQFAQATGLTPHAYLVQRRLHHARRLMRAGTPLAEVAAASGFADQSHLTRLFARTFGTTPHAYLRAHR